MTDDLEALRAETLRKALGLTVAGIDRWLLDCRRQEAEARLTLQRLQVTMRALIEAREKLREEQG